MGVIKHKDVFTSRYVTAIVSDTNDELFFVPIKQMIGNYWVTELRGNIYAFTTWKARILTYRPFIAKSVKVIEYDTSHFMSVQANHQKELELFLKKNRLPRVNRIMLEAFRFLGKTERYHEIKELNAVKSNMDEPKFEFTPHIIEKLINELSERQKNFPEQYTNMIQYLDDLGIDEIVTPVRQISDYLQEDLITTPPSFFGESLPRYQRMDNDRRRVSNKPVKSTLAWIKWLIIVGIGITLIWAIIYGIDQGWFSFITSPFEGLGSGFESIQTSFKPPLPSSIDPCSDQALQNKYTPLELKIAIDQGTETCKLSPEMQKLVDTVELPKVQPKQ